MLFMSAKQSHRFKYGQTLLLVLLVIALYVILPQLGQFHDSWQVLQHVEWGWLALGVILVAATYFAAAATYCFLSFRPIPYPKTILVQLAAMFVNRLLPAGVGAIGTNFAYLKKQRHSNAQAASIVALNNFLGFAGHALLLAAAALWSSANLEIPRQGHSHAFNVVVAVAVGVVAVAAVILLSRYRHHLRQVAYDLKAQVLLYARKPWRLPLALSSSITLTLCNVLALNACAAALGVDLSFVAILLIFSAGVAAGTVTPTPGGLGGFEAGLVAGFIAYHIDSATALAIALLFRLISYWLALAVGAVAFLFAQRRGSFGI
jgi:undecaprenyl-diphosphatase